jgi:hypothetical protein
MGDETAQNRPDISDILVRKQEGRRAKARRSFGEKITRIEAMREDLLPLRRAREARRAAQAKGGDREL